METSDSTSTGAAPPNFLFDCVGGILTFLVDTKRHFFIRLAAKYLKLEPNFSCLGNPAHVENTALSIYIRSNTQLIIGLHLDIQINLTG